MKVMTNWYIGSSDDPRWNQHGKEKVDPDNKVLFLDNKIKKMSESLGEPPNDLRFGSMED